MIFLADESVDFPIIQLLRQHDFNILAVIEKFPSKEDSYVLETAQKEGRLLINNGQLTMGWCWGSNAKKAWLQSFIPICR